MTSERQFIEVTNGRWWYENKVGEVMKVTSYIEDYKDEALDFEPTKAYAVERHGELGYVLAEDCREWGLLSPGEVWATAPEEEASEYEEQVKKVQELEAELAKQEAEAKATDTDMVNHPSHYTYGKFEVIEIIEEVTKDYGDSFMGYCIGNAQKYIARAPHKGKLIEDLRKAAKYIEFAVKHLEGNE